MVLYKIDFLWKKTGGPQNELMWYHLAVSYQYFAMQENQSSIPPTQAFWGPLSEGPGVLINPGKDEIGKFSIVPPTPNPNPYPEASLWGTEATIPLYFPCFPSPAPSESPRCVNYHSQHIPREATEKAHSLGRSPSIRPSPSLQHPYPRSK